MRAVVSADALAVAGLQPFSSVDLPGRLAAVVFLQGCPWRCGYCHNPALQAKGEGSGPRWPALRDWLEDRLGRLDGVVFSGGEPTLDPALPAAIDELRGLGYAIGLHTAGLAPRRLAALLPRLDWVGLDIKAAPGDAGLHDRITGRRGGLRAVRESLALLQDSGLDFECRSTVHPNWFDDVGLLRLVRELADVPRHVLQLARLPDASGALRTPVAWPSPALLAQARAIRPGLQLRG
ncbi:anaerobic ribonucleoside-triphosphate reductase activating protein [Roseateles saccharophilus]|uniref:Pyruvate formate lyase activating enzyme n=1 Tax=Roseateles saccharophilus TaxID=304 RepID=A0A4R3V3X0_ROSSA|nr:anaerobic ribonucleoside-triphosphate reductase activating protein [Roseateles saccharophilus]MDG0832320.1 anaerobic ribonucleoside-triphosphate reductase activating protein [Roseateles saccharophilus]TCU97014.1 pyruvate formate lyase activating enzyme [Roseateles saccharophilus]